LGGLLAWCSEHPLDKSAAAIAKHAGWIRTDSLFLSGRFTSMLQQGAIGKSDGFLPHQARGTKVDIDLLC
jgi:hypothetical protein